MSARTFATSLRILAGALLLAPALAAAAGRLAIVPLAGDGVEPEQLARMTGQVREGAVDPAWHAALIVEYAPGECEGDGCEVELARRAGATLVVSGRVRSFATGVLVELTLRDVTSGQLAAARTCEGATGADVLGRLAGATEQLLLSGLASVLATPVRPVATADSTERFFRWARPGWSLSASFARDSFRSGPLASHAGGMGGVHVGAGLLGVRVASYVPGAEPAVGLDVLHDAGVVWRSGHEEWVLLLADLEATFLVGARYGRNGDLPEQRMNAYLVRVGMPGVAYRYGRFEASFRPSYGWWTFGTVNRYSQSLGFELAIGTLF